MKPGTAKPKHRVNLWHLGFGDLLAERGSPGIRVVSEWSLPVRVRRADFLLIRREDGQQRDHEARSLCALWPRLSDVTIMELKSPGRAFRPSELIRLVACGALYHEHNRRELVGPHAITLAMVLPELTPSLRDEVAYMRWTLEPLERGYARILGTMYTTYVAFTNEITEAEDDDYLRVFSDHEIRTAETVSWLDHWMMEKETMLDPKLSKPEGYDEMMQKIADRLTPEQRLRGLPPEERLRGLPPEERLRGLPPEERLRGLPPEERLRDLDDEQTLLALPASVLRHLPEDYLRSLSPAVQKIVRERIARSR
jgi:hypothetical protein